MPRFRTPLLSALIVALAAPAIFTMTPLSAEGAASAAPASPAPASSAAAESAKLQQLLEDSFEENLELNPIQATAIGDPRYNDLLPNFLSKEDIARQERYARRWLEQMKKLDRSLLTGQDRLSYDIFVRNQELALEGVRFPGELIPIDQMSSLHSFFAQLGSGQSIQPFQTEKDYRDWLSRATGGAAIFDQAIVNMREGVRRGVVNPKILMEKVLPQLQAHMVDDPTKSVFYQPIATMPESIPQAARDELAAGYRAAIAGTIVPSYTRLHDYIRDEYIPKCRDTVSFSALPDGAAWYSYQVKTQTTTDMTPNEIHQFGLSEVERITGEMREVMKQVKFERDLQEFFQFLETDARFYYSSKEELLQGFRDLQQKINPLLTKAFDVFPKADYEVVEVPSFMEASSAGAFYQPGTPDGSRPGRFFVNTFNLKAQPKYGMETLSIHEAAPGHHFQISIAQEVKELPRFRRFGGQSAYFEGWALYAESLGREIGLFQDPYQYFGRLNDEMLRAMRLVVDTGLHHKGWTRDQSIKYMMDNSSMAESDVIAEVERYIAMPGQALSYKVGQRVIAGLRAEAQAALGSKFDLKAFHRAILIDGSLPMGVLKTKMDEWLAGQKSGVRVSEASR